MSAGVFKLIGIVCNRIPAADGSIDQLADEWTVQAVRECGPHLPLAIPSLPDPLAVTDLMAAMDGFLFPGGVSNVAPACYGAAPADAALPGDACRDALSLPLIRAAIDAGKPVFFICRGFQELNVALGGTLHQKVHALAGRMDHREPAGKPADIQFAPAHPVTLCEGGMLARLLPETSFLVNSLHGQGVDALAPPLRAEALAPDGQIEAASLPSAKGFVLGVQWHPEWRWSNDAVSRALFGAFAAAVSAAG